MSLAGLRYFCLPCWAISQIIKAEQLEEANLQVLSEQCLLTRAEPCWVPCTGLE